MEMRAEKLIDLVNYQEGSVVSRTIVNRKGGTVTLFAFDAGQSLSEHTAAFDALACDGLARVDFFVSGDDVVVNEVNTMPGFTDISMYPRMWGVSGVDYPGLVDRLVKDALRKGTGLH